MRSIHYSCAVTLLFVLAASGFAQTAGVGGLSGVVRDASGAVVPGAQVTITNDMKGVRRGLETTSAGVFTAPALAPAKGYRVRVAKEGFAPYEAREIEILVGQDVSLNVLLQVSQSATVVEVTAATPVVESTKTDVSAVVESTQIQELPINGRRVDSFVLLTPAVVPDGAFGLLSFRGIAGGNAFLTDGNDTTNQFYNENAGRTRITTQISQDAVQEFQVVSNAYSAEFGRALGGVVNTVTRSGSNDVHGTAYWFFRNQDFNARDRYATINPSETRHQAGGSIGGAIKRDKLFYFLNTEIVRRDFPAINRIISNALTNPSGAFNAKCDAKVATQAQCDAAKTYITRTMDQLVPRTANSELAFGKLDWHPTDRNSVSASFNYLRWLSPNGIQTQAVLTNNNAMANNANSTVRTRYGRVAWTSVTSNSTFNELRFGWFKDRLDDPASPSLWPQQTGPLYVEISGVPIGAARDYPRLNPSEQRFEIADNFSWTRGAHEMKFGGNIRSTQDYLNLLRNRYGSYSYSNFSNFAADFSNNATNKKRYSNYTQTFGNPILDFAVKDYDWFVQDKWRATKRLMLNFGVRYEYTSIPQPKMVNPDYPQTGKINAPKNDFAPRLGISYSLNDKTVLRGGYGLYYARYPGALIQTMFFSNGLYQPQVYLQPTAAAAPVFPNILTSGAGLPAGSVSLDFAAPDFHNPYTQQGDIAIEREITKDLGLTVSYIWSRGIGLFTTRDLNAGPLGPTVTYPIADRSGNIVAGYATPIYLYANRVDKRYSRVLQVENGGQSWYNGLAVQLRKRMSHGVTGSLAYTWSHAIDTANMGGGTNALFFDGLRSTYNGDYSGDKGTSSLDQRHRLVVNFVWAPVFTKNTSAFAKYAVNNWQLSTITTLASAQPATATLRVVSGLSKDAAFNSTLNGFGGSNRVPFWPWNSLPIDQVYRVDARLSKVLPFNERVKATVNFEAFNVFNTVSNTYVETQAYTLTNGVITPAASYGYGTQSQGFPDGTNARRAQLSMRLTF